MKERQLHFKDHASSFEALIQDRRSHPNKLVFILDQLVDIKNIGGLFRLADAANITAIYGYKMPSFLDHKKFQKVARTTHRFIPYHPIAQEEELGQLAIQYDIIALERTTESIPFTGFSPSGPIALIIGNEIHGVSAPLLAMSSQSIHIPMYGINNSMNVTVATGIATYQLVHGMKKAWKKIRNWVFSIYTNLFIIRSN